jgi:hypothetical protein
MKRTIIIALCVIILLSSCNRWTGCYGGSASGCTAWYPKKFKANPKPIRPVRGPRGAF